MNYVYVLGTSANRSTPEYDDCYVGVTSSPWKRFREHRYRDNKEFIEDNSLSFDDMEILFVGSAKQCYELERKLRPNPNMGRNTSAGGKGGWQNNVPSGSKNVKAKQWIATDPNGVEHFIDGAFDNFCKQYKILSGTLRRSKGPVPPLTKKYGGFRAQSEEHLKLRNNTTGWSLKLVERN